MLLAVLTACWWDSTRYEMDRLDTGGPRTERSARGPAPPAPGPAQPGGAGEPTELPAPRVAGGTPLLPSLAVLRGSLRVVAPESAPRGELAWLRITLRHRNASGTRLAAAHVLAALATDAPLGARGQPSLRRAIENVGGSLEASIDMPSTQLLVTVPKGSWAVALGRVAEALASPPTSSERVTELRDQVVRELTERFAADPLDAAVARVLTYELQGVSRWLAAAEDTTMGQLALQHAQDYRCNGSVVALFVPGVSAEAAFARAAEVLGPWLDRETVETPALVATLPPARGMFWANDAAAATDRSAIALVFDVPPATHPQAAAERIALECVGVEGVSGRLGTALRDRLGPDLSAGALALLDDGLLLHAALRMEVPASDVRAVDAALRAAWRSLAKEPPDATEVRAAAERARLRTLALWADPAGWLRDASHAAQLGLAPTRLWLDGSFRKVPDSAPHPWAQLLDQLARPDQLDVAAQFERFAQNASLLIAVGGNAGPRRDDDTFADIPDAFVAAIRRETVAADLEAQRATATATLERAVTALGGRARLLAVQGFHGVAVTRTGRGPEAIDDVAYGNDGALRRTRNVLGTRIDTEIRGRIARETCGDETVALTTDEARAEIAAARRHPLLLLGAWLRGTDRYRAVSVRPDGDRSLVVMQREDDPVEQLRLHVDSESGLVRAVVSQDRREIGVVFLREEYRDYRSAGGGVRAPFYRATYVDDALTGTATTWQSFTAQRPASLDADAPVPAGGGAR
ncbi:MAG: hypothetical protein IPM29_26160 [Planctomycetes bacterium]|nr:hypothetical protein [Planctomycetota bacterium]